MKDREIKIKKEIEELLIKPIIVSIADVDRFEKKIKKIRPIKNAWYDCLINYITKSLRKSVSVLKDEIMTL